MPRSRFVNRPYEALYIKDYLPASSIATATGAVIETCGLLLAPIIEAALVCKLACARVEVLKQRL